MTEHNAWFVLWVLVIVTFLGMVMNTIRMNDLDSIETGGFQAVIQELRLIREELDGCQGMRQ